MENTSELDPSLSWIGTVLSQALGTDPISASIYQEPIERRLLLHPDQVLRIRLQESSVPLVLPMDSSLQAPLTLTAELLLQVSVDLPRPAQRHPRILDPSRPLARV